MKELTIDATIENIATVTAFIDEQLEHRDCPMKTKRQVHIAIDELSGSYGVPLSINVITTARGLSVTSARTVTMPFSG